MNAAEISTYNFNNKQSSLAFEVVDLSKLIKVAKQRAFSAHRLNFYQILFITKGSGTHEVDFQKIQYSENTVIPVAMGQVQRFTYNPQLEGYALVFTPDFLVKESIDYSYLYDFTIFLHTIQPVGSIANKVVYSFIKEMLQEQQNPNTFNTAEYQRNLLKNVLIQLERYKRKSTNIIANDSFELFIHFKTLVEQNISYKLKVNDLCEQLNVSAKQLNNCLKSNTNTTAKQFIENRVILEIKRLIGYSIKPIKEIAYEIGFDDPTNFTKYFKAHMNILPAAYRKQNQS